MVFMRQEARTQAQAVTSSSGAVAQVAQGASSASKKTTETVVAQVAQARYVGKVLMESMAWPKSDSALETFTRRLATRRLTLAVTVLPVRSCQTVARLMPPVITGTARSVLASASRKGAATPTAVALAQAAKRPFSAGGTPRLTMAQNWPVSRPRPASTSCLRPEVMVLARLALPMLVTMTMRRAPLPMADCETMPSSAATRCTCRRLSVFNIRNSAFSPTDSFSSVSLTLSAKLSRRKFSS
mmetsp:Transcript_64148/g.199043  ORF Transcript_64148/g.199043 Transcript_64148/m.199043 type:complete len:242 (-) Transcript_64148:323-1048(-)